jgi:hypothetical protein
VQEKEARDMSDLDEASADRAAARKRVEKRRGLQGGFIAYVVVNSFLVVVWGLTGGGYFWPAWILAGWGVGMLLGLWDYLRGPIDDADVDVDAELRRMHRT